MMYLSKKKFAVVFEDFLILSNFLHKNKSFYSIFIFFKFEFINRDNAFSIPVVVEGPCSIYVIIYWFKLSLCSMSICVMLFGWF